ncbi:MAG: hypothetical protein ABII01_00310 [Candidatus Woesearchaeota archaeon]
MPIHQFLGSTIFGFEFIYTVLIVILCALVYFKTKEPYELTKYRGIGYFRNAFLFFGLAYLARFLLYIITLTVFAFDFFIPRRLFFPIAMIPVGYLSTMAIFYLTYSLVWKKIKYNYFFLFSNIIAILVSTAAFISRSHILLTGLQVGLLIFTAIISLSRHSKGKKKHHARALYLIITIFWVISLFLVGPTRFLPFEITLLFQILSIIVFITIYYKVIKWIK